MNCSINKETFNHIINAPKYFSEGDLTFIYNSCDDNCLGFILPKRLGAAHQRNLFKRRCRSIFNAIRKQAHFINFGVIIKTKQINIPFQSLSNAFINLSNNMVSK